MGVRDFLVVWVTGTVRLYGVTGTVRWLRGERDCQLAGVTGTFR